MEVCVFICVIADGNAHVLLWPQQNLYSVELHMNVLVNYCLVLCDGIQFHMRKPHCYCFSGLTDGESLILHSLLPIT